MAFPPRAKSTTKSGWRSVLVSTGTRCWVPVDAFGTAAPVRGLTGVGPQTRPSRPWSCLSLSAPATSTNLEPVFHVCACDCVRACVRPRHPRAQFFSMRGPREPPEVVPEVPTTSPGPVFHPGSIFDGPGARNRPPEAKNNEKPRSTTLFLERRRRRRLRRRGAARARLGAQGWPPPRLRGRLLGALGPP